MFDEDLTFLYIVSMCIMPYYGLFLSDLHALIFGRDHPCSLLALFLCSMTHYDITMSHDVRVTTLLGTLH